jgi:hypothetical protein
MEEQVWTVVQPGPQDHMVILAMLPANCGAYARTLAQSISIGAPQNQASALQMLRRDAILAMMRTQFGVELTLRIVEPKP